MRERKTTMNHVVLIGRLTRDPELSYTPNTQTAVCRFDIAVDKQRRQNEERTADFFHITVFGRSAENCDRYLAKGRQVGVHGRIETGSYKNRDGVTIPTFEIIADNVEFLGSGQQGGQQQGDGGQHRSAQNSQNAQNSQQYQQTQNGNGRRNEPQPQNSGRQDYFNGFDDLPDTFQAAEDDIPF